MIKSLGIIGCGAVTQNSYIKALSMYADVKPNYVFDINQTFAEQVASKLGAKVSTKEELLQNSDIVVIATPPATHFDLVKEALKPGVTVVCEKPFVGTVSEGEQLIALAAERKSRLFVAHFRRTFPSVLMARSIVKSGILGRITKIEAYEGGRFSWKTTSGYVYKDPYGGVLFDTGSHTIDMALFMAGLDGVKVDEVKPVKIQKDKEEPAHHVEATLDLQVSGHPVQLDVKFSRKLMLANKVRIIGENGFIDVPVGMANFLRLGTNDSSTVVYSNIQYADLMEGFGVQFKDMFYEVKDSKFQADLFINLTKVLEVISKN